MLRKIKDLAITIAMIPVFIIVYPIAYLVSVFIWSKKK